MSRSWKRLSLLVVVLFILPLLLAACGGVTTASCAYVVGTGQNGNDAKIHKIFLPGQAIGTTSSGEETWYVPCNSRNFIINDGSIKNANKETVGDRGTFTVAYTKTGVGISIASSAFWTLNQSQSAMENFWAVCLKYSCASKEDKGGGANYSTAGWNGMLAENLAYAIDAAARKAAFNVDDTVWQLQDPLQYKALADGMSAAFADAIRANLGYKDDLFCGSGNSAWSDPSKPGEGTFNCSPIRFRIDGVKPLENQGNQNSEGATTINKQRLENAKALYGDQAEYWLGLQDSIDKCRGIPMCIVNLGGNDSGPAVVVPNAATPTAMPTPKK